MPTRAPRLVILWLLATLVLATLACSLPATAQQPDATSTRRPTRTPAPTGTATPVPTATPLPTETPTPEPPDEPVNANWQQQPWLNDYERPSVGRLTVVNDSSQIFCYIYISPVTESTWGDDWLAGDEIGPGDEYVFEVEPAEYDLRIEDCNDHTLITQWGMEIEYATEWRLDDSDLTVNAPTGDQTIAVTIVNDGDETVCFMYVSPSASSSWGEDRLGSDILPVGEELVIYVAPDQYDFMAQDCDFETIASETGVLIEDDITWSVGAAGASVTPSGPLVTLTAVNNSTETVCYIYISPTTSPTWGEDWLGSDVLPVGGSFNFSVQAGSYDLKAEDCDHNTIQVNMGVSVNSSYTWYIVGD